MISMSSGSLISQSFHGTWRVTQSHLADSSPCDDTRNEHSTILAEREQAASCRYGKYAMAVMLCQWQQHPSCMSSQPTDPTNLSSTSSKASAALSLGPEFMVAITPSTV